MKVSFWFVINFVIFLACFCDSALTPEVNKIYSDFISGKGLYNDDDGIVLLNSTNFKTKIYGTNNAWLVEFYNSWCGHCHKFAPVWKALAANLYEWRNVVQLAAIDCAEDENTSICREYDIMMYPTVKFFPANSHATNTGTELIKISSWEKNITRDLVGILQKEQLEGRGNHWPNITPYRNYDMENLWKHSDTHRYVFLIFAAENNPLAAEVTLDLSSVEGVEIRGVAADNEILSRVLGVRSYPSLLVLERSKQEPEFLHPEEPNREAYRLAIKTFLRDKGFAVPEEPRTVRVVPSNEMPSPLELQEKRGAFLRMQKIKELGDVVFLVDLESTIRYSLEHEVSTRKSISGEALRALNNYLQVLAKYFPMSESGVFFMQKLRDTVFSEREMKGLKFRIYLSNISGGLEGVLSTKKDWMGCRGSKSGLRGYPCGVWTLFHYLTVNALEDARQAPYFDPLEVLEAMVGYVTYFFGCTECSKHFQQMVNGSMRGNVTDGEQAVLWLWSAHNEVNKRLAKDESEDPEFPKIQFPSAERCPDCRHESGDWNKQNVLKYLRTVYDRSKLNQMGSSSKLVFANKYTVEVNESHHSKSEFFDEEVPKKISKDFNIFDICLCVVLYVFSSVICVGVCLKFILKKRHRRKSHSQDLLNRV